MLYTILPNVDQTSMPIFLTPATLPQVVVERVDHSVHQAEIELSKIISFTERPERRLTLDEQAVFDRAWRRGSRVRQVIQL